MSRKAIRKWPTYGDPVLAEQNKRVFDRLYELDPKRTPLELGQSVPALTKAQLRRGGAK